MQFSLLQQYLSQHHYFGRNPLRVILNEQLNSRQHLVVPRAGRVYFFTRVAEFFR